MEMKPATSRSLLGAGLLAALALGAVIATAAVDRSRDAVLEAPAGLSAAELATWRRLSAEERAIRAEARETMRALAQRAQSQLAQPDADLRALAAEGEARADRLAQQLRSLRERKLDLYDSLSGAQQAEVRERLRERIDRMQRLGRAIDAAMSDQ
jgi:hypothetical protein